MNAIKNTKQRLFYLDNLRALMIILVVFMHTACTYSGFGSWYYTENKSVDTMSSIFFGFYQAFTQAYFMSLLFMLAGYFIPYSIEKNGTKQFIMNRLFRLGIPTIIFVFLIDPIVKKISHPNINLVDYYMHGILSLNFISWTGPLWFAAALLCFTFIYLLVRKLFKGIKVNLDAAINVKNVLMLIILITISAFMIRIIYPIGTSVMNFQFCYFAAYIFMFSVGIISYYTGLLDRIDYEMSKRCFIISLAVGIPSWLFLMSVGGPLQGNFTFINGGLYWQSLAFSLWESFFCVTFIIGLTGLFKNLYNSQNSLQKFLADNSFGVYVFHAFILTSISVVIKGLVLPPVLKFIMVAAVAVIASFVFAHLIRQVALLRKLFS